MITSDAVDAYTAASVDGTDDDNKSERAAGLGMDVVRSTLDDLVTLGVPTNRIDKREPASII